MRIEVGGYFKGVSATRLDRFVDLDKAHGRIERRSPTVSRETGGSMVRPLCR